MNGFKKGWILLASALFLAGVGGLFVKTTAQENAIPERYSLYEDFCGLVPGQRETPDYFAPVGGNSELPPGDLDALEYAEGDGSFRTDGTGEAVRLSGSGQYIPDAAADTVLFALFGGNKTVGVVWTAEKSGLYDVVFSVQATQANAAQSVPEADGSTAKVTLSSAGGDLTLARESKTFPEYAAADTEIELHRQRINEGDRLYFLIDSHASNWWDEYAVNVFIEESKNYADLTEQKAFDMKEEMAGKHYKADHFAVRYAAENHAEYSALTPFGWNDALNRYYLPEVGASFVQPEGIGLWLNTVGATFAPSFVAPYASTFKIAFSVSLANRDEGGNTDAPENDGLRLRAGKVKDGVYTQFFDGGKTIADFHANDFRHSFVYSVYLNKGDEFIYLVDLGAYDWYDGYHYDFTAENAPLTSGTGVDGLLTFAGESAETLAPKTGAATGEKLVGEDALTAIGFVCEASASYVFDFRLSAENRVYPLIKREVYETPQYASAQEGGFTCEAYLEKGEMMLMCVEGRVDAEYLLRVSQRPFTPSVRIGTEKELSPEGMLTLSEGEEAAVYAETNGISLSAVDWSCDSALARVENGAVKGLRPGSAVLRLRCGEICDELFINVVAGALSFETPESLTVKENKSVRIRPENFSVAGEAYTEEVVLSYCSYDESVAVVDTTGQVSAISRGVTQIEISAASKDGEYYGTAFVRVEVVEGTLVNVVGRDSVPVGGTIGLEAVYANNDTDEIVWENLTPAILTLSAEGKRASVVGLKYGFGAVRLTVDNASVLCHITVFEEYDQATVWDINEYFPSFQGARGFSVLWAEGYAESDAELEELLSRASENNVEYGSFGYKGAGAAFFSGSKINPGEGLIAYAFTAPVAGEYKVNLSLEWVEHRGKPLSAVAGFDGFTVGFAVDGRIAYSRNLDYGALSDEIGYKVMLEEVFSVEEGGSLVLFVSCNGLGWFDEIGLNEYLIVNESYEKPDTSPKVDGTSFLFDKAAGKDLNIAVDLKGKELLKVYMGSNVVSTASYRAEAGKLVLLYDYLSQLADGKKNFSVETESGTAEFEVEITDSRQPAESDEPPGGEGGKGCKKGCGSLLGGAGAALASAVLAVSALVRKKRK